MTARAHRGEQFVMSRKFDRSAHIVDTGASRNHRRLLIDRMIPNPPRLWVPRVIGKNNFTGYRLDEFADRFRIKIRKRQVRGRLSCHHEIRSKLDAKIADQFCFCIDAYSARSLNKFAGARSIIQTVRQMG